MPVHEHTCLIRLLLSAGLDIFRPKRQVMGTGHPSLIASPPKARSACNSNGTTGAN